MIVLLRAKRMWKKSLGKISGIENGLLMVELNLLMKMMKQND